MSHDSAFWRRLARLGAAYGPEWWVRYSPPFFGVAAAIAVPSARRTVLGNLRRIHGPRGAVAETIDVARTFAAYAGCLAEVLSNGSRNERMPSAVVDGRHHLDEATADGRGVVIVTTHTAGWEIVGPLLSHHNGAEVMMVMARERNQAAQQLQDAARRAAGLHVANVGGDPFASLPLLQHLRKRRGVVALQLDRTPPGMRARDVTILGGPGKVPEGPLRLAALSGAPLLPLFCARTGYRQYIIQVRPPVRVSPRPSSDELDDVAQRVADEMSSFLRKYPTQWFHFA